jgi:hypothetical protein
LRRAAAPGSRTPLLRAGLPLLELSSRKRVRALVLARATTALERMQRSSSSPELDRLQARLDTVVGVGGV